ncbi:hypothetical protein C8R47DRAFT_1088339 [Mycena vitilis]|nr:hypothetical protein C8R47DRAFT_1088339 [Mycena vitilis]
MSWLPSFITNLLVDPASVGEEEHPNAVPRAPPPAARRIPPAARRIPPAARRIQPRVHHPHVPAAPPPADPFAFPPPPPLHNPRLPINFIPGMRGPPGPVRSCVDFGTEFAFDAKFRADANKYKKLLTVTVPKVMDPNVLSAKRRALRLQLAPGRYYRPRPSIGAYENDSLPDPLDPELIRDRARLEQPRGRTEFSLQMLTAEFDPRVVPGKNPPRILGIFVPADEALAGGVVETPDPEFTSNEWSTMNAKRKLVVATSVPQEEITHHLTAFFDRDRDPYRPLEVEVREETVLHSTERTAENIDDIWDPVRHYGEDYGGPSHEASIERAHRAVTEAVEDADSPTLLGSGTPFTIKVSSLPEARPGGAVLFVPDDPTIPALGTDKNTVLDNARAVPLAIRKYQRELRELPGQEEVLGRHKRKWESEGAEDDQRALKKICGVQGRDTITRHMLLDMEVDNIWFEKDPMAYYAAAVLGRV